MFKQKKFLLDVIPRKQFCQYCHGVLRRRRFVFTNRETTWKTFTRRTHPLHIFAIMFGGQLHPRPTHLAQRYQNSKYFYYKGFHNKAWRFRYSKEMERCLVFVNHNLNNGVIFTHPKFKRNIKYQNI